MAGTLDAIIKLLPTAINAAGTIFGAVKAGKERKKQEGVLDTQERDNQDIFNKNYYADYLNRKDVGNALATVRDNLRMSNSTAQNGAAVLGSTQESIAAEKANNAKSMTDAISGLSAAGEQYKDSILNNYTAQKNNLANLRMGLYDKRAESAENVASSATQALVGSLTDLLGKL